MQEHRKFYTLRTPKPYPEDGTISWTITEESIDMWRLNKSGERVTPMVPFHEAVLKLAELTRNDVPLIYENLEYGIDGEFVFSRSKSSPA